MVSAMCRLPDERIVLDADVVRLAQVFSNLLNNAAKYAEPGGLIQVTACREGPDVVVAVTDDGVGELIPLARTRSRAQQSGGEHLIDAGEQRLLVRRAELPPAPAHRDGHHDHEPDGGEVGGVHHCRGGFIRPRR